MPIKQAEFTADEIVFIIERAHALCALLSKIRFVHLPRKRKMAIAADETKKERIQLGNGVTRAKNFTSIVTFLLEQSTIMRFSLRKVFVTRVTRSKGNNARRI